MYLCIDRFLMGMLLQGMITTDPEDLGRDEPTVLIGILLHATTRCSSDQAVVKERGHAHSVTDELVKSKHVEY